VLCHAHPEVRGRLDHDFASAVVGHDVLMPVSAPVGRGRAVRPLHRLDGGGVPVLAFSAASGLGRIVAALRGRALDDLEARTVFTAHLAAVLRSMALDGRGVAWLPQSLIDEDLKARRLLPAAPASWRLALDIRIFRSDSAHGPAAQALWSALAAAGRDKGRLPAAAGRDMGRLPAAAGRNKGRRPAAADRNKGRPS
jgi:DNA-binding transcriptional LysR family regulator